MRHRSRGILWGWRCFCLFGHDLDAIIVLIVLPDTKQDREPAMKQLKGFGWAVMALAACLYSGAAHASEEKQEFTQAFLNDEAKCARGKEI